MKSTVISITQSIKQNHETTKLWNYKTMKSIVILMTRVVNETMKPQNHKTYRHYDDLRDGEGETVQPQNHETYRHFDVRKMI